MTISELKERLNDLRRSYQACGVMGQSNPRLARWLEFEINRIKLEIARREHGVEGGVGAKP